MRYTVPLLKKIKPTIYIKTEKKLTIGFNCFLTVNRVGLYSLVRGINWFSWCSLMSRKEVPVNYEIKEVTFNKLTSTCLCKTI